MTVLKRFAAYGAQDAVTELAPEVIHHAKRVLLDWFSALYPGTRVAPCLQLVSAHSGELDVGHSTIFGHGTTAFPATAAWINGSAAHAVEFDDIFRDAVYHPGPPIISAALAVAEDVGISGKAFLQAIVVGYEISTRIGAAIQPAHYRYFHTTGTVGCLGAAAAVAAVLAPGNASVMQHALSTSATFASGLQQAFRSDAMTKALHAGHAAEVGVRSGQAAYAGVTGVTDILEGPAGFGAAMADSPEWSGATEGLGVSYNVTRITQKNHGCCGHTFAAIDAALEIRKLQGFSYSAIEAVEVETYKTALDVTGNFHPTTSFECKFSLPYVVAHALKHGSVRLAAFDEAAMCDELTRRLMNRISLREDPALTASFPGQRAARVVIHLADGRALEHFSPFRKGDPESPLSDAELNSKYDELVSPLIGDAATAALRERIWNLESLESVRRLDA